MNQNKAGNPSPENGLQGKGPRDGFRELTRAGRRLKTSKREAQVGGGAQGLTVDCTGDAQL